MINAIRKFIRDWRIERTRLELKRLQKEQVLIDQAINNQTQKLTALQTRNATPNRRRNPGTSRFAHN